MNRHDISIHRRTSIAQRLPDDFENKLVEYQRYIIQLRKTNQYTDALIANADQTPLTFDIPFNHTLDFKGKKSIILKSTGNEKNRFTVKAGSHCRRSTRRFAALGAFCDVTSFP